MPAEYVNHTSTSSDPLLTIVLLQKRHKRTFSEDDRIQAQSNVKKVEDEDPDDIDEPEDPLMLQRAAKDWKVIYS
jgi:hypothetical protein